MRIAIVGAGAIGGWMGARLARAGHIVSVVARRATLAAIQQEGLRLVSDDGTIRARVAADEDPRALGLQELVIVAVKGPALASAAPAIAALCEERTTVLSAMNGIPWWFLKGLPGPLVNRSLASVDPQDALSAEIPPERVIGCVVHASCSVSEPGHIIHKMGNELIIGEPDGRRSPRLERINTVLCSGGFAVNQSTRIQSDIWYKLWGNMTMNPISALTGATVDRILDDELVKRFALQIMAEAAAVGERLGCPIKETGESRNAVTRRLGAFKTSMLRDAEAGRPLEIDALLAAPREIAEALDIPTPAMDGLHGLLRLFASVRGLDA